jgi:hypothetical protein
MSIEMVLSLLSTDGARQRQSHKGSYLAAWVNLHS